MHEPIFFSEQAATQQGQAMTFWSQVMYGQAPAGSRENHKNFAYSCNSFFCKPIRA
jgi:hypothetical protein